MIEWIVSSSVLILLMIILRFLLRNRLDLRVRYALWLLVAFRLLIPVSFFTSSISILNLLELGRMAVGTDTQMPWQAAVGEEVSWPEQPAMRGDDSWPEQPVMGEDDSWPEQPTTRMDALPAEQTTADKDAVQLWRSAAGTDFLPQEQTEDSGWTNVLDMGKAERSGDQKAEEVKNSEKVDRLLLGIWLLGVFLCMGVVAVGNCCYRRRLYRSRKPWKSPVKSRLPVYLSPVVSMPCLFGLVHPAIYLTPGAVSCQNQSISTWNNEKGTSVVRKKTEALEYVLRHENIHYRHHDNLWALVRTVCICIHWYNPLVWLAARLSRQDCELACDEKVLEKLGEKERIAYGRALLAFSVQGNEMLGSLQYVTTISGGKKQLKERLMIIVHRPKRSPVALVWAILLALFVSMMTFTGQTGKMSAWASDGDEEGTQASEGNGGEGQGKDEDGAKGQEADGGWEGFAQKEAYSKDIPFDLGDGREYVLRVNGRTTPGTGEYQTERLAFCLAQDGEPKELQVIQAEEVKVLYTRPSDAVGPFSDIDAGWPWIFSTDREASFAKPLLTLEDVPAAAAWAFGDGSQGEMWAYAPDGGILVADLNFDGYNDFCLQAGIGSVNVPYYCYLWNPGEGRFEPAYMIPNVKLNEETQLIESLTKDGEGLYSIKYYHFDERNILHLVRYVEENQSEDAVFPVLDLTYCEEGFYTLPAVDEWDYLTEYGGALAERLVYWAKQALMELYEWSGTKIDRACFNATEFGGFYFGNSPEDVRTSKTYYSRSYGAKAGFIDCIESMDIITEREVWYSDVVQCNEPEDASNMTDIQLAEWYFQYSPLAKDEKVAAIEESYEDTYTIRTESGRYYELTLDPISRQVSSVYGPYNGYPVH